jgi:hypothetical protein
MFDHTDRIYYLLLEPISCMDSKESFLRQGQGACSGYVCRGNKAHCSPSYLRRQDIPGYTCPAPFHGSPRDVMLISIVVRQIRRSKLLGSIPSSPSLQLHHSEFDPVSLQRLPIHEPMKYSPAHQSVSRAIAHSAQNERYPAPRHNPHAIPFPQ